MANSAELVHRGQSPNHREIPYGHMPRQGSVIRKDAVTSHDAIVGNVGVGQKMISATQDSLFLRTGSPVDRGTDAREAQAD
jgi:hypothetical protein